MKIVEEYESRNPIMEWLVKPGRVLSGVMTLIMIVAIIREVAGRYFFGRPSDWSLQLCSYLMVGIVYLGAADTELRDRNVRIDFIYSRLGEKGRVLIDSFSAAFGLAWCTILLWQGSLMAWHSFATDARSSDSVSWPLFLPQTALVAGTVLVCIVLIYKFVRGATRIAKMEK